MHFQVATQDQEDRGKRPVDRLRRVQAVSEGGGGGEGGWDGCRSGLSEPGGGWRGEGACHPLDFDRSVKPQRRSPPWRRGSVGLVTQGSAVRSPVLAT